MESEVESEVERVLQEKGLLLRPLLHHLMRKFPILMRMLQTDDMMIMGILVVLVALSGHVGTAGTPGGSGTLAGSRDICDMCCCGCDQ